MLGSVCPLLFFVVSSCNPVIKTLNLQLVVSGREMVLDVPIVPLYVLIVVYSVPFHDWNSKPVIRSDAQLGTIFSVMVTLLKVCSEPRSNSSHAGRSELAAAQRES